METGWVSSAGPFVNRFEEAVKNKIGALHGSACMNGTAALHLALLVVGVAPEEEVIVPTLTFIAPTNAVHYVGAHPVFLDCDEFLNLDPEKLEEFCVKECRMTDQGLENRKTGRRIAAMIVVHVYGHLANLERLAEIAERFQLTLVEDATESLGSLFPKFRGSGRHAGTIGAIGCLSFNGNKIVTTGGGGMIVTSSASLARRAAHLATQAKSDPLFSTHDEIGYNYRMTNLQAAVGLAQMERLDEFISIKRRNFEKYRETLKGIAGLRLIEEPPYSRSNYWHYSLVVEKGREERDRLLHFLREGGIECRPVWALGHKQKPFQNCQTYQIEMAEWFEGRILNLPCSTGLTDESLICVTDTIRSFYGKN